MKNERAIEELLAEMLKKQDQQTEVLSKMVSGQNSLIDGQLAQNKLMGLLSDKIELIGQKAESNTIKLEASLARIENQLTVIVPMLEKALDNKERIERIENFLSEKFKFNKWIE